MWWDMIALPDDTARMTGVVLDVLRECLRLPSQACQEGALHGLGHLSYRSRREVEAIIDGYLRREPGLHPALRSYARSAREGSVQ
jgi:hypothetical protein